MKTSDWDNADYKYAEDYLCSHAKMFFQFSELNDDIGKETFTERTRFHFECSITKFANDKIRVFYRIPTAEGKAKVEFSNDARLSRSGKKSLTSAEKKQVPFKRSHRAKTQVYVEYDKSL